jgi:hypothetical protein
MWWRTKARLPERQVLRCSFCRKHKDDVTRLIAGPDVFICDECVVVCNDVIADDKRFEDRARGKVGERRDDSPIPLPNPILCALCRKTLAADEGVLIRGNRGILCTECVNAVQSGSVSGQ